MLLKESRGKPHEAQEGLEGGSPHCPLGPDLQGGCVTAIRGHFTVVCLSVAKSNPNGQGIWCWGAFQLNETA